MKILFDAKIPMKTVSEANKCEHWVKKHRRHKLQKFLIRSALNKAKLSLPCTVRMVRIAPRSLDKEDNLPMSLKPTKDAIADYLIPGLQPGRADDDERIKWEIDQQKGQPREYAVHVTIWGDDE